MSGPRKPDELSARHSALPYTAADLPIDQDGRIYHLQIKPEQLAPDIVLVGDPGRAEFIGSSLMRDLELKQEHRGLVTVTGTSSITGEQATIISPVRTTAATSGMGTPSLEIMLGELVALNEIDFETRTRKADFPRLHVIRLGSSGGLQASTELGTPIITTYAIGLDNAGLFYEVPYPDETCKRLEDEIGYVFTGAVSTESRFYGKIHPYVSRAEPNLVSALIDASTSLDVEAKAGLTVSAPGFWAPQGRDVFRLKPSLPELDKVFSEFDPRLDGQWVENMEMESSFLLHFLGGLGYWAGSICPAIANRQLDTFISDYQDAMLNAAKIALLALAFIRNRYPDARLNG
jgi:uridine phosphorylase